MLSGIYNLSLLCLQYTPTTHDCLTEQAGGEVGWANVWKTQGVAVPSITDLYSLVQTVGVRVVIVMAA